MINAERTLDALGDRTRRRIFIRLRDRPRFAGELAKGMRVSRSAVSQHLQVLKSAGLVAVKAEGTRRLYTVDARGVSSLRDWLDGFWNASLQSFKAEVERREEKGHD
jgi:DNA-binding transcriptional ArsR family regulator